MSLNREQDRAVIYARKTNGNDGVGTDNQLAAGEKFIRGRGWDLVGAYVDEGRNATDGTRGVRPEYDRLMADAEAGKFEHVVPFHSSRLWRNRRERADAIEILRHARVSVDAVNGPSLDMSSAYGRGQAALLGEFDTMEGEVRAERQMLAFDGFASKGVKVPGGQRGFGFEKDHTTHRPDEAQAIADGAEMVAHGSTLADVMRMWNARGLTGPQTGQPFVHTSTVRNILTNPRNAGRLVRNGEVIGAGDWQPIITADLLDAITAKLARNPRPVRGDPSLLGGRHAAGRCACGNTLGHTVDIFGRAKYRCDPKTRGGRPGPHVWTAPADVIDALVRDDVLYRLSQPDIIGLVPKVATVNVAELTAEADRLRGRKAELGEMFADGEIDRPTLKAGTEKIRTRLAAIGDLLQEAATASPLAPFLAGFGRADEIWQSLSDSRRRQVIAELCTVRLTPHGRGKAWDESLIEIIPRRVDEG